MGQGAKTVGLMTPVPSTSARAAPRRPARTDPRVLALAALVGACGGGCGVPGDRHDLNDAAAIAAALAAILVAYLLGRQRRPEHRWDRHIALQLPLLAPERYCACGSCGQLAGPGSILADWHFDVPGVLPPKDAPDAIPIRGLAWSYGPSGWDPAIVYVVAHVVGAKPPPPRPRAHPLGTPSSNGHGSNGQATKLPSG
jgi:hypothetical protein